MRGQLARRIRLGVVLYGAMGALAAAIAWFRGSSLLTQPPAAGLPSTALLDSLPAQLAASLAGGALLAALTVISTQLLVSRLRWARALRAEFRAALQGATGPEIAILALASGTAEELLFRGAMQPALGLTLTSIFFGVVHFVPSRALLPWTAWAMAMGFLLGALHEVTGSIAGPVLAHVAINLINLRRIVRFDPSLDESPAHTPPSLVSRKRTRPRG